jgi:fermentation-respiration switch protein FrsA (DUF1100 family)
LKRLLVAATTAAAALLSFAPAASAEPQPFGRDCVPQAEVRFCGGDVATRVPTWDGVPLDVDVTLPPSGDGPFPTLVMLHGWGGNKKNFETTDPSGGEDHYSNVWFAKKGYAVVNYSARGFGDSCGSLASRNTPGCARGWLHLGDQRYEVRDTQHLLGVLVDQGVAQPSGLGVTGISYGGGQSLMLAYLNDRTRTPDGSFIPWQSPDGTALKIAAAWPRWPWSDLVASLTPNGRFLDFEASAVDEPRKPIGIPKTSYTSGLFATGATSGFYSPPGVDPESDLSTWFAETNRGEPETPSQRDIVRQIGDFHGAFGARFGPAGPPPLLIQNGWTDDLFPAPEALRAYNDVLDNNARNVVSLQLADLGHMRGQNKQPVDDVLNAQGSAFLDQYVARTGNAAPKPSSVTAFTQTCPKTADAGGPFTADDWTALTPGAVTQGFPEAKTVTSDGGNPQTGTAVDPISGGGACAQVDDEEAAGTAVYRLPVTSAFTMLGLPTVSARIKTTGDGGQLDARLWDVGPDGKQTLVSRVGYRLEDDQSGQILFQLLGNGWRFEPGHVAKLELTGRDAPFLRPSNGTFSVAVSDLRLEIPALEKPGTGQVTAPSLGRGPAGDVKRLRLSMTPRRVRAGRMTRFRIKVLGRPCANCPLAVIRGAKVRFGGKSYRMVTGKRVVRRRFKRAALLSVRATRSGYRSSTLRVRVMR